MPRTAISAKAARERASSGGGIERPSAGARAGDHAQMRGAFDQRVRRHQLCELPQRWPPASAACRRAHWHRASGSASTGDLEVERRGRHSRNARDCRRACKRHPSHIPAPLTKLRDSARIARTIARPLVRGSYPQPQRCVARQQIILRHPTNLPPIAAKISARRWRSGREAAGCRLHGFFGGGHDGMNGRHGFSHRHRHLSESQRAMVAAKLANMPQGARTDLALIQAMSQPVNHAAFRSPVPGVCRAAFRFACAAGR